MLFSGCICCDVNRVWIGQNYSYLIFGYVTLSVCPKVAIGHLEVTTNVLKITANYSNLVASSQLPACELASLANCCPLMLVGDD